MWAVSLIDYKTDGSLVGEGASEKSNHAKRI